MKMKLVAGLAIIATIMEGCSVFCPQPQLNSQTVNENSSAGSELMKRCQASAQKLSAQCTGANAADCQTNVQEVSKDCTGGQGIFDTLVQMTTQPSK
jgi:hypothetical protein